MSGLRVLFVTSGPHVPTTRYRIVPYLPRLRQQGIRCTLAHSFPEKYDYFPTIGWRASQWLKRQVRRWHLLRAKLHRYDVIVLEREVFDNPTWDFEQAFRRETSRFLLDIDDAIFLRYPEKFDRMTPLFDEILAGNRLLAEKCGGLNRHVRLLPTVVDLPDYPPAVPGQSGDPLCIGWIGTPANLPYLNLVLPALRQLAARNRFEFRIVTHPVAATEQLDLRGIDARIVRWEPQTAIEEIRNFSIGIMPLPDEDWARYKCGFKLLQYMACGLPAVASAVGVNREIVNHGANGLLAGTEEEWTDALSMLLQDSELRRNLGQAARKTVAGEYTIDAQFPTLLAALQSDRDRNT